MQIKFFTDSEVVKIDDKETVKSIVKYEKTWGLDVKQGVGGPATLELTREYPKEWQKFLKNAQEEGLTYEPIEGALTDVDPHFDAITDENPELLTAEGGDSQNVVDGDDLKAEKKKEELEEAAEVQKAAEEEKLKEDHPATSEEA